MQSDVHIRRVPLVRGDLKCPVCGKWFVCSNKESVELYSNNYRETRVVECQLLYCNVCLLPFASPQLCKKIKLENDGFHVEGFRVTQRDGVHSILRGMYKRVYVPKRILELERQREQERKKQQELQAQREAQLEKERRERMRAIPSAAVMICAQFAGGEAREFIIVNLQKDASPAENILHYKNPDALELLTAAFAWQTTQFRKLHGKPYKVTETVYAAPENRFFVNPSDIDVLTLRGQKRRGAQNDDTLRRIDVLLYSPYNDILEPQDAFIDEDRNVYMDAQQYRRFAHLFGNPKVTLDFEKAPSSSYDNLREYSVLNAFGYNVSAKDRLPAKLRQELLADLMDLAIVNGEGIINLLNFFIKNHPADNCADARWKWQEDLDFTRDYIGKPERFMIVNTGARS